MRKLFLFLIISAFFGCLAWIGTTDALKPIKTTYNRAAPDPIPGPKIKITEKLKDKSTEAKKFAAMNGYNEKTCFLIDMSISSGRNRFFVYDMKKDSLQISGLVTHGRCNQNWLEGRKYGNTVGCGCSSLGKYRVGYSYNGRFGLAYKLYGLDKTNNKAFERFVVLHSHGCVPETEIKDDICQSDGCPTVSQGYLQQLKPIISASKKPILLWIFE